MDDMTPEQRRQNMRRIRSTDTKPEILLRKALWHAGFRYRKNWKALPGKPDIALTKYRIVIFIDSEFFHGKNWDVEEQKRLAGNNGQYWHDKIQRNMERDREEEATLKGMGWTVIRFWSRDVLKNVDECVKVVQEAVFEKHITSPDSR